MKALVQKEIRLLLPAFAGALALAILPIWLVMVMSGWKGVKGCWPAILVSSLTMAGLQLLIAV